MTDSHADSTATQPALSEQPEHLDLRSHDIVSDKQAEIVRLFPEVRSEGGKVDFDRLKRVLGEEVDPGKERYGMSWPGKADCFKSIQSPSIGTLLPWREESVDFDTTQNVIIEGDNLEVLKLLQKAYLGKIKMVYIDPPYNTGNDFIYPDNYSESLQTYLQYTGQMDSEGQKFSTNTEADGRFHSKWMNMMYSRLYLAHNLLTDDGVLFASIDDHEMPNLVRILDEIFGEDRRIGVITVVSNLKGRSDDKFFATAHNYLLVYAKQGYSSNGVPLPDEYLDDYPELAPDGRHYRLQGLRKRGAGARRVDRPNMFYPIYINPVGKSVALEKSSDHCIEVLPKLSDGVDGRWRWGRETVADRRAELMAGQVGEDGRWDVFQIDYADTADGEKRIKPKTIWTGSEFSNETGTLELKRLFGKSVFDTVKPVGLLKFCIEQATKNGDIVLDFFAGSGTTGHAILEMSDATINRKFILVQLPEPVPDKEFHTLSEITRERVRRVITRQKAEKGGQLDLSAGKDRDLGFRAFRLAESNIAAWESSRLASVKGNEQAAAIANQLELHINHIRHDRTAEDLLYEILLKSGFQLTTKVEKVVLHEKTVYSVADGAMLICFEKGLTIELVKEIAAHKPERVILLDEGFAGNDQLKTNAVQIMKSKGVTSFRTV